MGNCVLFRINVSNLKPIKTYTCDVQFSPQSNVVVHLFRLGRMDIGRIRNQLGRQSYITLDVSRCITIYTYMYTKFTISISESRVVSRRSNGNSYTDTYLSYMRSENRLLPAENIFNFLKPFKYKIYLIVVATVGTIGTRFREKIRKSG